MLYALQQAGCVGGWMYLDSTMLAEGVNAC